MDVRTKEQLIEEIRQIAKENLKKCQDFKNYRKKLEYFLEFMEFFDQNF